MENVSLPSIDHMTGSKSAVTSPINRQHMPSPGQTTSEPKEILPPLSLLFNPTPQHNLSEIQRESTDPMNNHHNPIMPHHTNNTSIVHDKYNGVGEDPKQQQQQQQHQQQQHHQQHQQQQQQQQQHQHALRTNSPLFPASHPHISGQLNSSDHRPPQNNGAHSTQRAIAPDMRLPSIKHFENITNIQHSSSVKQHQPYPPQPQTANMHIHSQPPPPIYNTSKPMSNGIRNSPPINYSNNNNFNHPDLLSQTSHLAQNSTMWTRPQAIPHSPRQSPSPVITSTSPQKAMYQALEKQNPPVRFVPNTYSPDYQNNGSFVKDNTDSNVNTQIADKALSDMQKITDYCTVISQFATQYGDYRSQTNKFPPSPWTTPSGTPIPIVNLDQQVSEMINRTCEILNVLNGIKSEIGQSVSNDQDTINLIRTKRTTVGPSATRTKYRKRSKRAAPPGRCHSCNISETPEWRRGPDGARTLCNACGLHFAKLTRKRALSAMQQHQHQQPQIHKIRPTPVLPSIQPMVPQQKPPMGMMGGIHHLTQPLQSTQMMQSPPKRLRHDIPMTHQMNGPINGNYLKA